MSQAISTTNLLGAERKENIGDFYCELNSHCVSFRNSLFICLHMCSDGYLLMKIKVGFTVLSPTVHASWRGHKFQIESRLLLAVLKCRLPA